MILGLIVTMTLSSILLQGTGNVVVALNVNSTAPVFFSARVGEYIAFKAFLFGENVPSPPTQTVLVTLPVMLPLKPIEASL